MPSTAQQILAAEKAMVREFNRGDMSRLLAHFDRSIVGFSSTRQERVKGQAALKKTFDYYRQASSRMKYGISNPQVQVFGETAVATFYWTVELGSGRPRHAIHGRGTHVFVHDGGAWRIVHEHFSRVH